MHRDVSVGNILIIDDEKDQADFTGFLHDFDYSSMSKHLPDSDLSKCKAALLTQTLFADQDNGELKARTVSTP